MAAARKRKHNLVIVESPAKVKTIKKFLGSNYDVAASYGHVRDLPKSRMGIDVDNDYEPKYITIRGKGELLAELRKKVKKADCIYLATDPDREGEAISWHLIAALKLDEMKDKKVSRITFNEITKKAVTESLLSAGRVQSVALRMIGDREDEISAFIPQEYWTLDAVLTAQGQAKPFTVHYCGMIGDDGKPVKEDLETRERVTEIIESIGDAGFSVYDIRKSERTRKSPLPFTTSTLQQEASKALGFSTQKTMRIAQQLYEGVEIKGSGTVALITYLRTDSTRISEEAQAAAAEYILGNYGDEYLLTQEKSSKSEAKIQDAHEAIRPTDLANEPASIKDSLSRDQFRLYRLIWNRFIASRMSAARYEVVQIKVAADRYLFSASKSRQLFDGFQCIYNPCENEEKGEKFSVKLDRDSVLTLEQFDPKQHFTQPPPHYTEASLVKALEEQGIGRPSTYAPTITTILARHYIVKEDKNLYMTEMGEVVNSMMRRAFPSIVDPAFTAQMEGLLDGVAEGTVKWKTVIENFYPDLDEAVRQAEKDLEKVKIADEETDEVCENCGRKMVIKYGPHGKFLACPGFPDCHNTKPYYEKIGVLCPKCGEEIVVKKTKKGRKYYGCLGNPECDFMSWQRPSAKKCPECGGMMLEKGNRLVCENKDCGHVENKPEE